MKSLYFVLFLNSSSIIFSMDQQDTERSSDIKDKVRKQMTSPFLLRVAKQASTLRGLDKIDGEIIFPKEQKLLSLESSTDTIVENKKINLNGD